MASPSPPSLIERRREQMFPVLTPAQVEIAQRFGGEPRRFKPDEIVFEAGQDGVPAFLVLSGSIRVFRHDGLGHESEITTHEPGELTGDISQLAGGPTLTQGRAGVDGAEVVAFDSARLRSLVIATSEMGEAIMRALILRRAFLIEAGAGLILLGASDTSVALRLQNFLRRNYIPYTMLDPGIDADAASLIEHLGISQAELPLAVCPNGTILRSPNEKTLAHCLGLLPSFVADRSYDVAIVGAGPAGLAAAVYAGSEGLSVLVLDAQAPGGQAGASARIENYLGFPTGISGQALLGRAYTQAQKFGAVTAIPAEVKLLKAAPDDGSGGPGYELELDEGQPVRAAAIVIASGARYRTLDLPNLGSFEGRGVYYWASPIESKLCARREVVVVGGGNSAGQGTVFLASHVSRVHLLVRGASLSEAMSQYLVTRIGALPNVEVHTETELTQLIGEPAEGLQAVCWRHLPSGKEERRAIHHVFLFIGAMPNTDWLKQCAVSVDSKGFVHTGEPATAAATEDVARRSLPLETSLPGVFAVGDVRANSVKRVSAAVGEGAAVVAQLHGYLHAIRPEHQSMTPMGTAALHSSAAFSAASTTPASPAPAGDSRMR